MLYQKLKKTVLLSGYTTNTMLRNSKEKITDKKSRYKSCFVPAQIEIKCGKSATEF